ncbi:MAG: chemotaxis protein CheB [Acidobacteriota bacterium]
MAAHDIVVIGASAGGVEAISAVVASLPADLPAAVFVVLHVSRGRSVLPEILTRVGPLPAVHPDDGTAIQHGRIYVARPDHHLTIERGRVRMLHGPTENGSRPAVDPLFRSAARTYGSRVVGVVLTGALDDGTAGLAAVKEAGGITIVQDPAEAFASSMPRSAAAFVPIDYTLKVAEIGARLTALARSGADRLATEEAASLSAPELAPERLGPHVVAMEPDAGRPPLALSEGDRPGKVSVFTCPECHGTLWEAEERGLVRYRCRVGHIYSPESMLAAQTDSVDRALWIALRSLEERAALTHRLAARARTRNNLWVAKTFDERALAADGHAATVRDLLVNRMSHHEAGEPVPDLVENAQAAEMPKADTKKSE